MTSIGITATLLLCISIFIITKKYYLIPFLLSVFYLPKGEFVEIFGFKIFAYRFVLLTILTKLIISGEIKKITIEKYEVFFYGNFVWISIISGIQEKSMMSFLSSFSVGFDAGITYLFTRLIFFEDTNIRSIINVINILFFPLMILLLAEKFTAHNYFSIFNGVKENALIRNGVIRAAGPFSHAILTGTAAAVYFPFSIFGYNHNKLFGLVGIISILGIIYASGSSGPIMTLLFTIIALCLWYKRNNLNSILKTFYFSIIVLEIYRKIFKNGHVWDYLSRIDLTGSSTGWHRAALITSFLNHINEWWLIGTNYTRHWMPTGVSWSTDHTDITNHYIIQGVNGGLISFTIFIFMICRSFKNLKFCYLNSSSEEEKKICWIFGSILFSHAATFISVAYFDQTVLVYYSLIGTIAAFYANKKNNYIKNMAISGIPNKKSLEKDDNSKIFL